MHPGITSLSPADHLTKGQSWLPMSEVSLSLNLPSPALPLWLALLGEPEGDCSCLTWRTCLSKQCYFTNLHFPIICSLFLIWPFMTHLPQYLQLSSVKPCRHSQMFEWLWVPLLLVSQATHRLSAVSSLYSLLVYGVHWIPSPYCNLETQAKAKRERAGLTALCLWAYMPCFVFSLGCAQIHFDCIFKARIAEHLSTISSKLQEFLQNFRSFLWNFRILLESWLIPRPWCAGIYSLSEQGLGEL